jgi:hypothetical protein
VNAEKLKSKQNLTYQIMKKILFITLIVLAALVTQKAYSQGFVTTIEGDAFAALFGNPCILKLESGEEIQGKLVNATGSSNGLNKISVKLENGEKAKFEPQQVISLRIKASGLLKLAMVSESTGSITEMSNTDFKEIVNREYVIFETALTARKTDTYRLLQLLNPGFDNKIKVFAEPSKKTGGFNVGGLQLTGGEARAYLFVKGKEKAVEVKKGSYSKNFEELYSDCPKMLATFQGEKIMWDDVALHVFAYDQACK